MMVFAACKLVQLVFAIAVLAHTATADDFEIEETIGESLMLSCSGSFQCRVWWTREDGTLISEESGFCGNPFERTAIADFTPLNDTVHRGIYICRREGLVSDSEDTYTVLVHVPLPILNLQIQEDIVRSPTAGRSGYTIKCNATEERFGLSNRAVLTWFDSNDQQVNNGNGITVTPQQFNVARQSILQIEFDVLRTSDAQRFTCLSVLHSPALPETGLTDTRSYDLIVEIPLPSVSIEVPDVLLAGSSVTLTCSVGINEAVDTPMAVTVVWRRAGEILSSDGRITITGTDLTFSTLSMQDGGSEGYSCEVTVDPNPPSFFITPSESTTSATVTLTIQEPSLAVTTSATSVDIIDVEPHNTFSITCTATAPDSVTVSKSFQWERVLQATSASETVSDNGDSVTIVNSALSSPTSTSTLTVRESTAGGYTYTCTATLQTLGVNSTSSTGITVRGPTQPVQPVFQNGGMTDFSSFQIEWIIPRVAYTPESYVVMYGTSADTLDLTSETVIGSNNIMSIDERFSVILRNLDPDTTIYFEIIATNSVDSTSTDVMMFTTQSALIVALTTEGSLEAGSSFTVICTVTDAIDDATPTVVWLDPSGGEVQPNNGVTTDGPTVNGATTTLGLLFNPLRASHQGDYMCRAEITASETVMVTETQIQPINPATLDIPVMITIASTPMPVGSMYQAASSVTLTCEIDDTGTSAPLTYQWTSTCVGDCFVRDQTSPVVSREGLRSIDAGSHTCTVIDDVGNMGSASAVTMSVVGVGLYLTGIGPLPNNSIVIADSTGVIDNLQCISASEMPDVGRFISPSGEDISETPSMPFDITVGAHDDPGHVVVSVAPDQMVRISDGGIYTCIIPDETDVEQSIHIGIYGQNFNTPVTVDSLERRNASTFTLSCTTSGSPPTTVTWVKDGSILSNEETFQTSQTLLDGTTSTYNNFLMLDTGPIGVIGTYICRVNNDISLDTEETITLRGLQVTHNGNTITGSVPLVFTVNSAQTLSCSTDLDVMKLEWMRDREVVASSSSQQLDLVFNPVNDTIHSQEYACVAVGPYGSQEQAVLVNVRVLPTHVNISIRRDGQTFTGEPFSLMCEIDQAEGLTSQQLNIQWLDSQGNTVDTGDGVSILGPVTSGTQTTSTLSFDSLILEHGRGYVCFATLPIEAPPFVLEREALQVVNVVPSQILEIDPVSAIACDIEPFNEFTLTCTVNVLNPEASIETIDWRRTPQGSATEDVVADGLDIVITQNLGNPTSTSVLTVNGIDVGTYTYMCVAVLDNGGEAASESADITIQGAGAPVQPTVITATDVTSQSATISWTMPLLSCLLEEYIVEYGLSQSSLDRNSDIVTSDGDPSMINARFSVQLTGLPEDTAYFYRVVATNSIGSTLSGTRQFDTPEPAPTDPAATTDPIRQEKDSPIAAIAGAIVGVIVVIVIAILVICFVVRRRRINSQKPEQTAIGYVNPGIGADPVLVSMEPNTAYDTVGRWSHAPPAASNQYRGNSLVMLGPLPPPPYDLKGNQLPRATHTEPIYEKTAYENADEMIPVEGRIVSQQSDKEDNRSYLQLGVEAPPASTSVEMQPYPQPEEVPPLHAQPQAYDVPMAVTKFSPLISGAADGEAPSQPRYN